MVFILECSGLVGIDFVVVLNICLQMKIKLRFINSLEAQSVTHLSLNAGCKP